MYINSLFVLQLCLLGTITETFSFFTESTSSWSSHKHMHHFSSAFNKLSFCFNFPRQFLVLPLFLLTSGKQQIAVQLSIVRCRGFKYRLCFFSAPFKSVYTDGCRTKAASLLSTSDSLSRSRVGPGLIFVN